MLKNPTYTGITPQFWGCYAAGMTESFLHNRRTAAKAGVASTGHAVPGGEVFGPLAVNMFIGTLGPGNVAGIADDARLADSESGPLFVHTPSMRLASWSFTGGADG